MSHSSDYPIIRRRSTVLRQLAKETFQYDGRHRLWKVFRDTGGGPQLAEESLYSASGNLTKKGAVTNYLYKSTT